MLCFYSRSRLSMQRPHYSDDYYPRLYRLISSEAALAGALRNLETAAGKTTAAAKQCQEASDKYAVALENPRHQIKTTKTDEDDDLDALRTSVHNTECVKENLADEFYYEAEMTFDQQARYCAEALGICVDTAVLAQAQHSIDQVYSALDDAADSVLHAMAVETFYKTKTEDENMMYTTSALDKSQVYNHRMIIKDEAERIAREIEKNENATSALYKLQIDNTRMITKEAERIARIKKAERREAERVAGEIENTTSSNDTHMFGRVICHNIIQDDHGKDEDHLYWSDDVLKAGATAALQNQTIQSPHQPAAPKEE